WGRIRVCMRKGLPVGVLILACAAAYWLGSEHSPPPLLVEDRFLDFGETWLSPEFEWTLPIRNTGTQDIEISGVISSCSCLSIKPTACTVRAGETVLVTLTLDLTRALKVDSTGKTTAASDFSVSVRPLLHESSSFRTWVVHGFVRTPFTLSHPILDFGTL